MMQLPGNFITVGKIDRHVHICDLIDVEGPLLSLYRDDRASWLYQWADTDKNRKERWLLYRVDRAPLVGYLQRNHSLLDALRSADLIYALDVTTVALPKGEGMEAAFNKHTRQLKVVPFGALGEYLPAEDSFFDESLTEDIRLDQQIAPTRYAVPIDGSWFIPDLDKFSRAYTRLYSFFYCTQPRFVANLGGKLAKYLRSPWQGGYSRINMFDALHGMIPAIHDMKVARMSYASPGEITIEALDVVGARVRDAVLSYIEHGQQIKDLSNKIDGTLAAAKLKKLNVSQLSDERLGLADQYLEALIEGRRQVGQLLGLTAEFEMLTSTAPNCVVAAKATLAVLVQLGRIAEFQHMRMLDLGRPTSTPIPPNDQTYALGA